MVAALEKIWGKYYQKRRQRRLCPRRVPNTVVNSVNLSCVKASSQCLGSHCVLDCRNGVGWASGIGIFSTLLFILRTEDSSAFCLAAVLVPFFFSSQTWVSKDISAFLASCWLERQQLIQGDATDKGCKWHSAKGSLEMMVGMKGILLLCF